MKKKRFAVIAFAVMICAAAGGCGKNKSEKTPDNNSPAVTSETGEASAEMTSDGVEKTSQTETSDTTEGTVPDVTSTTAPPTTEAEKNEPEGYTDSFLLAQEYYNAYINHDAETVYAMFDKNEIDGYNKMIEPELDGLSAKEIFRRAAVIRAIEASMDNISEIMDYYSNSENDEWSILMNESDLTEISQEDLDSYNEELGTSYTKAVRCLYMFYIDNNNGESFSGNSSAFVEKDGLWYLSYSSAMSTDLLNYIELE